MVILGSAFTDLPVEVEAPVDDLTALRLELVLEAMESLRDSLNNLPQPQVFIDAPDLSAIVSAVNGLKPGADPDEIAAAVIKQIAPTAAPVENEMHTELVAVLKKLDFRLKGLGGLGSSITPPAGLTVLNGAGNPVPVTLDFPASQAVTGTVAVNNFPPNLAAGTWGYSAGVSGTLTLTGGKRVLDINAHSLTGGTVTINGGDTIPVPANVGFTFTPSGALTNPVIVFTGTDSYSVEFVT